MPIQNINPGLLGLPKNAPRVEPGGDGRKNQEQRQSQHDTVNISSLGAGLLDMAPGNASGNSAVENLSARVSQLAGEITESVLAALEKDGLVPAGGDKLSLRLVSGALAVGEDTPKREAVEDSLNQQPELVQGFAELAGQSSLLQGLMAGRKQKQSLRQGGVHAYAQAAVSPINTHDRFRLSILDGRGVAHFAEQDA